MDNGACNQCKTSAVGASFAINAASKHKDVAAAFIDAMSTPEMGKRWIETVYLQTGNQGRCKVVQRPLTPLISPSSWSVRRAPTTSSAVPRDLARGECKDSFAQVMNSAFPGGLLSVDQAIKMMNTACFKG